MATYTSYLNLEKPTTSETFNLLKLNQNWDKIDAGVSALTSNIKSAYTNAKILTILADVTFTNGIGEIDLSDYIPSGYRISIPFANATYTGSLTVTGCKRKEGSNTIVVIRVGQSSYSDTTSINMLTTLIAI